MMRAMAWCSRGVQMREIRSPTSSCQERQRRLLNTSSACARRGSVKPMFCKKSVYCSFCYIKVLPMRPSISKHCAPFRETSIAASHTQWISKYHNWRNRSAKKVSCLNFSCLLSCRFSINASLRAGYDRSTIDSVFPVFSALPKRSCSPAFSSPPH